MLQVAAFGIAVAALAGVDTAEPVVVDFNPLAPSIALAMAFFFLPAHPLKIGGKSIGNV